MASQPAGVGPMATDGLHIRPLNIEKGTERFSLRSHTEFPPQTVSWRSNLTALSQRRNLFFAASIHQIHVWEPTGSSQTLGKVPAMIITPVMKCPQNSGYIAPHAPHAINNILVGDLGLEEVLLLVTDSGNVCGYRVEAVFSALERAEKDGVQRPLNDVEAPPFFVESVASSAWGLAIHKFSRQIAVSANTGLITVFAFALANSESGDQLDPSQSMGGASLADNDQTWLLVNNPSKLSQLRKLMPHNYRTRNIRMTFTGHFTNIPSVSFLNSDIDPNGTWMVSTDIDNKLIIWKPWESLNPINVFHFNQSSHFIPGLYRDEDRGWAVLALDPRTFRQVRTAEEALGGPLDYRVKNGEKYLDTTQYVDRIPDASHLYNYFPPAVKSEPEQPALPDIFSPDCRAVSPSDNSSHLSAHHHESGDSADAPSRWAVDCPLQGGDASQGIDHEANTGTEAEQATGQSTGDTTTNALATNAFPTSLEELIMQIGHMPQQHTQGPLTAAQFFQMALIEGLGGHRRVDEGVEFFDHGLSEQDIDDDDDDDDDDGMDDFYEEDDSEQETEDDPDADNDDGNFLDHVVGTNVGTVAYNVFDRMFRSAFPDDPDPYGHTESLIPDLPSPASAISAFPILHFSQTDIRLIPSPHAPHHSVACFAPLRQPFTNPVPSSRACDRFNMIHYIPEHGIVVATSQKGRAAIIALTENEETGPAFRVDWIVPFESQEKYGERPLKPLLGMSVGPMPGFELPADVPSIPRLVGDASGVDFHYRFLNHDSDDSSTDSHSQDPNNSADSSAAAASNNQKRKPSHAECHAWASRIHRPDEAWRGWNPSRRYRLMLMYADHTIMTYEFWYETKTEDTHGGNGGRNRGRGDAMDEDPYLNL